MNSGAHFIRGRTDFTTEKYVRQFEFSRKNYTTSLSKVFDWLDENMCEEGDIIFMSEFYPLINPETIR